jgi:succinate dehydrogenase / fumarate reductase cytochrome b subunit
MAYLSRFAKYSIGKKYIMGISGLGLCVFALVHLSGNFLLLKGQAQFNAYADILHNKIPGFVAVELGLAACFILHMWMGISLAFQNRKARPQAYAVKKSNTSTLGSLTMAYTGTYFILFLIIHLLNIKFAILPKPVVDPSLDKFTVTAMVLAEPMWSLFYVVSSVILGIHLSHGFYSAFQSLGLANEKTTKTLLLSARIYGVVIAVGYSFIAVSMLMLKR